LTLGNISLALGINSAFLADTGLEQNPAKSTISDGNKKRNRMVFEEIFFKTIDYYGSIFKNTPTYIAIDELKGKTVKLIDSATISVCLGMFERAKFRGKPFSKQQMTYFHEKLRTSIVFYKLSEYVQLFLI
jgi:ABC-type transporter Mla MlaB component